MQSYAHAIEVLGKQKGMGNSPYERDSISVKLTALHPHYALSHYEEVMKELLPDLIELCQLAQTAGIALTIDAEEAARLELSLDLIKRVSETKELRHWDGFGLAVQAYQTRAPAVIGWVQQSFFRGFGGLGQGLGTALGVKLAARSGPVVLLVGDGGFLYNPAIQALGASKEHDLPILIVIFNNKGYMAMQKGHVHHYPDGAAENAHMHLGSRFNGFDYDALGAHFGLHGERSITGQAQRRCRPD